VRWGDGERSRELAVFLLEPVAALGLKAEIWGARYPEAARRDLSAAGSAYRGWLPNYRAPEVFARHRVTVHVPRGSRAYRPSALSSRWPAAFRSSAGRGKTATARSALDRIPRGRQRPRDAGPAARPPE
jgi:hypothetical protein